MIKSNFGIENHGLSPSRAVHWNNSVPQLVEFTVSREEGRLSQDGALCSLTGKRTGRSPNDKFIVQDSKTSDTVDWGKVNKPISIEGFDRLHRQTLEHMSNSDLFVTDAW